MYILEKHDHTKFGELTREQNCPKCDEYFHDSFVTIKENSEIECIYEIDCISYHHFNNKTCTVKAIE